ncbi:MAG: hypothetical protein HOP18_25235 [Deltaproteobacteria bacterium]|nr:hypothetical protein [Deltaproteobacteria bacterium]
MATGKQVGEFSLKATSITLTPGPGGSVLVQGNFEGTSAAFGAILRTATFVSVGAKSGTFSVCAAAYLENGDTLTGNGQGTFESIGRHKWRLQELIDISDGRTFAVEGEIDLAARSWTGKIFERN